ncbi:RasGEF domain-containing protein [Candidatus Berkiella aquae]|uniref:RhoGEF domain protein n=1 Tax=Candidatus Berkiella aquae TaxID=295108 RepID=A0A0Q9YPS6_9GAMM|nr:RasGEF domain-containing protein [Candidatus Berkiella aquae]MCS5710379.1 hypothetical protein [Candidatus Berkiella aquae]
MAPKAKSPKELALELKNLHQQMFAKIEPDEFVLAALSKEAVRPILAPNVTAMKEHSAELNATIRDDILLAGSAKEQRQKVRYYAELLAECSKNGDYFTANEIYNVLKTAPGSSKLVDHIILDDTKSAKILAKHDDLFNPAGNNKNLIAAIEENAKNKPIPEMSIILKQITGADEIAVPVSKAATFDAISQKYLKLQNKAILEEKLPEISLPTVGLRLTSEEAFQRAGQIKGSKTQAQPNPPYWPPETVSREEFINNIRAKREATPETVQPNTPPPSILQEATISKEEEQKAAEKAAEEQEKKIADNVKLFGFTRLGSDEQGGIKEHRLGNNVYRELISSEKNYLQKIDTLDLKTMVAVLRKFDEPVNPADKNKNSPADQSEMTRAEAIEMFDALVAVKEAQKKVTASLLEADPNKWAEALKSANQAYAEYTILYNKIGTKPIPDKANELFKEIHRTTDNISSILITPVQRGPRYNLLIRDIMKNSPENIDQFNTAAEKISQFSKILNEAERHNNYEQVVAASTLDVNDFKMKLQELAENIKNNPDDLVAKQAKSILNEFRNYNRTSLSLEQINEKTMERIKEISETKFKEPELRQIAILASGVMIDSLLVETPKPPKAKTQEASPVTDTTVSTPSQATTETKQPEPQPQASVSSQRPELPERPQRPPLQRQGAIRDLKTSTPKAGLQAKLNKQAGKLFSKPQQDQTKKTPEEKLQEDMHYKLREILEIYTMYASFSYPPNNPNAQYRDIPAENIQKAKDVLAKLGVKLDVSSTSISFESKQIPAEKYQEFVKNFNEIMLQRQKDQAELKQKIEGATSVEAIIEILHEYDKNGKDILNSRGTVIPAADQIAAIKKQVDPSVEASMKVTSNYGLQQKVQSLAEAKIQIQPPEKINALDGLAELKKKIQEATRGFSTGSLNHLVARALVEDIEKIQKLSDSPEKDKRAQEYIDVLSKSDTVFKSTAQNVLKAVELPPRQTPTQPVAEQQPKLTPPPSLVTPPLSASSTNASMVTSTQPDAKPSIPQPAVPKAKIDGLAELKSEAIKIKTRFQIRGVDYKPANAVLLKIEEIQKLNSPTKERRAQEYIEALSKSDNDSDKLFKGPAQSILVKIQSQKVEIKPPQPQTPQQARQAVTRLQTKLNQEVGRPQVGRPLPNPPQMPPLPKTPTTEATATVSSPTQAVTEQQPKPPLTPPPTLVTPPLTKPKVATPAWMLPPKPLTPPPELAKPAQTNAVTSPSTQAVTEQQSMPPSQEGKPPEPQAKTSTRPQRPQGGTKERYPRITREQARAIQGRPAWMVDRQAQPKPEPQQPDLSGRLSSLLSAQPEITGGLQSRVEQQPTEMGRRQRADARASISAEAKTEAKTEAKATQSHAFLNSSALKSTGMLAQMREKTENAQVAEPSQTPTPIKPGGVK